MNGRWGVIAAAIPSLSAFADRELELLGGLAQQTKLALQSAVSYETLERTFLATVEALANALEANDEHTSTHARWITDLALKVGVELGLEPKELKRLELGALFHDIFACDAFHAMTTDRPYRRALSVLKARRRLEEASGSQFDPAVIDALRRVLDST